MSLGEDYLADYAYEMYHAQKEQRKQTNADRIRSMTNEELAKFIYEQADCFCQARFGDCIRDEEHCRKAWLKWLKEEVKRE